MTNRTKADSKLDLAVAASDHPQHDKLAEVAEVSQAIGEFLDYGLGEQGLVLAQIGNETTRLVPTSRAIPDILARYFGIDQAELEREKGRMLAALGAMNR